MFEQLVANWQLIVAVAAGVLGYGELRWRVGRHDKILNSPFDVLKATVSGIDKKMDVLVERQTHRDKELEAVRVDIREERKSREDAIRRVYQKLDSGHYRADPD